jgi:hypothetical protein
VVAAWQLDYLIKTDVVELARFLPVDPIDRRNEFAVAAPLAILLDFPSPIAVLGLIGGFSLSLALVFAKDCLDGLLARGVACHEVEQLPHCLWFAASELVDKFFISRARDECSNHIRIYDIRKLIALLGKSWMYLCRVSPAFCL